MSGAVERWACWVIGSDGKLVGVVWRVWAPLERAQLFVSAAVGKAGSGSCGYCQAVGGGVVYSRAWGGDWEELP